MSDEIKKLNEAVSNALQEVDTRVIRKQLFHSVGRGESLLGTSTLSIMAPLVRATLQHAEYAGLNGEDTYTLIAYRALVMAEKFEALLIHEHMLSPSVPIFQQVRP